MYCNVQECVYRIIHPQGARLSMRFSDLRLHTTDRIQVGVVYP